MNEAHGIEKEEQTGVQQWRVVARRLREQHNTEAGRIQGAVQIC